jgi:hypothetical protein
VAILLSIAGCAAQREATPEMMRHELHASYAGMSDSDIYSRIRDWVLAHCTWDGDVLQHDDADAHALMARGRWERATSYAPMIDVDIDYTMSVEVEKGEVRFSLSRLVARSPDNGEEMTFFSNSEKFHVDADQRFQSMLIDLDAAITSGQ